MLEKWYKGNKETFEVAKRREMTAFQEFVTLMKACGAKRTDVPEDPVLQGRLREADKIFEDAK